MALFKEHVAFGAVIATVGVVLLYFYAIVTDPILLMVLFVTTMIGSFLPDLDSDTGTPFYTVFGAFTICSGGATLYYMLTHHPDNYYLLIGTPIATMLIAWFVLGTVFKRFTHHRGMMHSLPVMAILGLAAFLAARYIGEGDGVSLFFAIAVGVGVLSHLFLDEVHSENLVDGNPFVNKRSLGTAFKLFSRSLPINLFTYLLLAALLYKVVL
jgi:membrane-bound metal-dependent hydrolase YbcI (DUF457 family)